ncbi:Obscurin [Sesbania bispinosa]|nr:Obscurin [Sesbania bispinosa]
MKKKIRDKDRASTKGKKERFPVRVQINLIRCDEKKGAQRDEEEDMGEESCFSKGKKERFHVESKEI